MTKELPYGKQWITDDDVASVVHALTSPYLTTGPKVTDFESAICDVTGAKYAVACSNGTTALHLACLALEVSADTKAVTTPITFLASANCVEYCGGSVDFVDIDPDTINLDINLLEERCRNGSAPTLVIPVHFAGLPADMPRLAKLANEYTFSVIEDGAHAIGSTYQHEGQLCRVGDGKFSDLTIFSFHPVKTITTGEGGAIVTNDEVLAERLRRFRSHGMSYEIDSSSYFHGPWCYQMNEFGYNYRITDFQCALGVSQLARLDEFKQKRFKLFQRYNELLADCPEVMTFNCPQEVSPAYHLYPIQFRSGEKLRLQVYEGLRAQGIFTQVHYIPVHWQPYYRKKYGYQKGKCPEAERYYSRCLSLPLFPAMDESDVERVVHSLRNIVDCEEGL